MSYNKAEFAAPEVADRAAFQAELDALRVREKAHTREGDANCGRPAATSMVKADGSNAPY